MNKILTEQAKMCFEITQWYLEKDKPLNEALILALTHIEDIEFRKEFEGFPYNELKDGYVIFNISREIEKFIQNIKSEIITLKDIFLSIDNKENILSKLKINYKVNQTISTAKQSDINSLLKYGYDLVQQAEEGLLNPIIGRENEIGRIIHVLSRKIKNNPLLVGGAGTGKAQPLYSKILTINGWVNMGNIKVGDKVITPKGKISNILGVFPQGIKEIYEIEFKDGRTTRCCKEHLWKIYSYNLAKYNKSGKRVVETEEILYRINNTRERIYIELINNIDLNNNSSKTFIHPYIMGVLLGDGSLTNGIRISNSEPEIHNKIKKLLNTDYDLNISSDNRKKNVFTINIVNIKDKCNYYKEELKNLGLENKHSYEKFIPKIYLNMSYEDRLNLLNGLLDTDGYVCKNGTISYDSTSKLLAEDMVYLVHSLGGMAKITNRIPQYTYKNIKKLGRKDYRISIRHPNPKSFFTLKRKKDRISDNYQYKNLKCEIKSIKYIGKEEAQCIYIDDSEHLYITDNFIVTHNTACVEAVAQHIAKKNAGSLNNKRIISLDLTSIVAGTKYRGDFENRMQEIISALKVSPDIILFIDEIHNLIGHSGQEFGNIFKPYLSRGEIQVIGATTDKEYRDIFQKEKALDRRFQAIVIKEPTMEETLTIINGISNIYEDYHNVKLNDNITKEIVNLSGRYMNYRKFPDKAIDILDELCSYYKSRIDLPEEIIDLERKIDKLRIDMSKKQFIDQFPYSIKIENSQKKLKNLFINFNKTKNTRRHLTIDDLYQIFYKVTGIPVGNIKSVEKEMLLKLEDNLNNKVIGQSEAIKNISKSIIRSKLGYTRKNKPIASFMFAGTSGTGKTLCAQVLADILFPNQQKTFMRFDMSEYIEPHTVSKLVGSPKGYVGYGEGGLLTNFVKENPYSIILFDEIEKANETVQNLMLQILDNGSISDTNDEQINFSNTIIIFTSNCITEMKSDKKFGFLDNKLEDNKQKNLFEELKKSFRPEFLNRMDYMVFFEELKEDGLRKIIDLEIEKLSNEYLTVLKLKIDDKVRDFIISKLTKKNARYITKAIQNEIIDKLIEKSLKNELDINKLITITEKDAQLLFDEIKTSPNN